MTDDIGRPKTYLVFAEGAGFALVAAAAMLGKWPELWPVPMLVGSALLMIAVKRNNRYLRTKPDQ